MSWFEGFESRSFEVNGASIAARFSKVIPGDIRKTGAAAVARIS
jgi:hypothetical protein